jgi:uncharacterized protein YjiS (DUF1127 family)
MKTLLPFAIYKPTSAPMQSGKMARQTQVAQFRSRTGALRQQRPSQLTVWLKALATSSLITRFAEYRAKRQLRAHLERLAELSDHLLDDVGVTQSGSSDFTMPARHVEAMRAARAVDAVTATPAPCAVLAIGQTG